MSESRILQFNQLGMQNLRQENFNSTIDFLQRAKKVLKLNKIPKHSRLWNITFNNLGCYYKRIGNYPKALKFFEKGTQGSSIGEIAGSHLNLCTLISQMGSHSKALDHAHIALKLIIQAKKETEFSRTVALAYYNIGIENQFLKRNSEASAFLKAGLKFTTDNLKDPQMIEIFRKSLSEEHKTEVSRRSSSSSFQLQYPKKRWMFAKLNPDLRSERRFSPQVKSLRKIRPGRNEVSNRALEKKLNSLINNRSRKRSKIRLNLRSKSFLMGNLRKY